MLTIAIYSVMYNSPINKTLQELVPCHHFWKSWSFQFRLWQYSGLCVGNLLEFVDVTFPPNHHQLISIMNIVELFTGGGGPHIDLSDALSRLHSPLSSIAV